MLKRNPFSKSSVLVKNKLRGLAKQGHRGGINAGEALLVVISFYIILGVGIGVLAQPHWRFDL